MQAGIDSKIKQAQRKGASVYVLSGLVTLTVLTCFAMWLFFIKGFSLLIGPSDALTDVKVERVSGLAWVGQNKLYTLGAEVVIQVSSPTFERASVTINNQSPSTIEILLQPSPAIISAKAILGQNRPEDSQYLEQTQWFLNGILIHLGEALVHKTPPGNYQLEVTNPYFQNSETALNLGRAETINLLPQLPSIQGQIIVNSMPSGVEVMINNTAAGKTPLVYSAEGGEYRVQLVSADYIEIDETIAVQTRFLLPKRNYQLLPKPGILNVSATPNDGLLLINNVEYSLGQIELAANKSHKIQYQKPGHASYSNTIKVNKDTPTNLVLRLEALYGEVTISTNIPANITINGLISELSPVSKRLLAVDHVVEISAQGFRSVKQTIRPQANSSINVNINLLTEFEARRREGKPLFANTLGINLLRFVGDAFTLGSAANETGRRRNEHEVDVDFSRPFWVSEKEITQAQFSVFLGASALVKSALPVTDISWIEAAQYCNWLSQQEGLPMFYIFQNGRYVGPNPASNGYRLPTEAEWEWLAKKAKRATSTVYVWGNQEKLRDNLGNFADQTLKGKQLIFFEDYQDGKTGLAEVGSYKADRTGLFDLDGNVSEWVHDYYTNGLPDTSKRHIDYLGELRGESWVIKGGNFETGRVRDLRAAFREFSTTGKPTVGFRIARYDTIP